MPRLVLDEPTAKGPRLVPDEPVKKPRLVLDESKSFKQQYKEGFQKITQSEPMQFAKGMGKRFMDPKIATPGELAKGVRPEWAETFATGVTRPIGGAYQIATGTPYKTPQDKEMAKRHPVAKFTGEAVGSLAPYVAASMLGVPPTVTFPAISGLTEATRQRGTKEDLTPAQRIAKVGTATAGGYLTALIFGAAAKPLKESKVFQKGVGWIANKLPKSIKTTVRVQEGVKGGVSGKFRDAVIEQPLADPKIFETIGNFGRGAIGRMMKRAIPSGGVSTVERLISDAIENKYNPKEALAQGALTATTIGALSIISDMVPLRGLVMQEARMFAKATQRPAPKNFTEAKALLKDMGVNPERLSPQVQKAVYNQKRNAVLQDMTKEAKKYDVPKDIVTKALFSKNAKVRAQAISDWISKMMVYGKATNNPYLVEQATYLAKYRVDMLSGKLDPVDALIRARAQAAVPKQAYVEAAKKTASAVKKQVVKEATKPPVIKPQIKIVGTPKTSHAKLDEISKVIQGVGGKIKGIADKENSIYDGEETVYFDDPSGSTHTLPVSQVNEESVKAKFEPAEEPKAEAPKGEGIVGELPKEGLVVANKGADGKLYVGKLGDLHFSVAEKYAPKIRKDMNLKKGEKTFSQEGFIDSSGQFMTPEEALKKTDVKSSIPPQLDAKDYQEQALSFNIREGFKVKPTPKGEGKEFKTGADKLTMEDHENDITPPKLKIPELEVGKEITFRVVDSKSGLDVTSEEKTLKGIVHKKIDDNRYFINMGGKSWMLEGASLKSTTQTTGGIRGQTSTVQRTTKRIITTRKIVNSISQPTPKGEEAIQKYSKHAKEKIDKFKEETPKGEQVRHKGKLYRRVGESKAWDFKYGKQWKPVKSYAIKDELNKSFPLGDDPFAYYDELDDEESIPTQKEQALQESEEQIDFTEPTKVKGDPQTIKDVEDMLSWTSAQAKGERIRTPEGEWVGAKSGHMPSVQQIGPAEASRVMSKFLSGQKLVRKEPEKLASLLEDFRENIKPQMEETKIQQVSNIIKTSKSALEAQKAIKKEFGWDMSLADIKRFERQIKGGMLPDMTDKLMDDIQKSIQTKEPATTKDFGSVSVLGITPDELHESVSAFGETKERIKDAFTSIANMMKQVFQIHTYLDSKPASRPIIDGVNQAFAKEVKFTTQANLLMRIAKSTKMPKKLAELFLRADRNPDVNVRKELATMLAKGEIKVADFRAGVSIINMGRFIWNAVVREVMASRLGIRVRSQGMRYFVNGRRHTEAYVNKLNLSKEEKEALEQVEVVTFKHADPKTGEYVTRKIELRDYAEVGKYLKEEENNLIKDLLPFKAGNWISHARKDGNYWVELFEPTEAGHIKVFSARVLNKAWTDAFEKLSGEKMGSLTKEEWLRLPLRERSGRAYTQVKKHNYERRQYISMGSPVDVQVFLHQLGIDPQTEVGQKIVNAYRSMSPLLSSLNKSQNIKGYREDWTGIVEGMHQKLMSSIKRVWRADLKELTPLAQEIEDKFLRNVSKDYLQALAMPSSSGSKTEALFTAIRSLVYFMQLANKMTFFVQNITEPVWAFAIAENQLKGFKEKARFLSSLGKEYQGMVKRAKEEGLLKSFFTEEYGVNKLHNLEQLGRQSEKFSSKKVFEVGLHLAYAKGLKGEEAYKRATNFLLGEGKPFYHQANKFIAFSKGEKGYYTRKYGMIFLTWVNWWMTKAATSGLRLALKFAIILFLLAGGRGFLFGRRILAESGLVPVKKNPRHYTLMERFLLGGVLSAAGVSTAFLRPLFLKGMEDVGAFTRNPKMIVDRFKMIPSNWEKYGLAGLLGYMPLAGAERFILGAKKAKSGILEKQGGKTKRVYEPKTKWEKLQLKLGIVPFELGEYYAYKYGERKL